MSSVVRIESFPEENRPQVVRALTWYTGMYAADEFLKKLPVEFEVGAGHAEPLKERLSRLACTTSFVDLHILAKQLLSPEDQAVMPLGRAEIMGRSIRLYWQNFRLFLALSGIFWLPMMAGSSLPYFDLPVYRIFYAVVAILTTFLLMHLAYVLILWASSERLLGRRVQFVSTVNRIGVREFFRFAWAKTLVYVVTLAGYILLIIPGILWSIRLSVSGPVAVIEGKTGAVALRRSALLVRGRGGTVFETLLEAALVVGVASRLITEVLTVIGRLWGLGYETLAGFTSLVAYTITTPLIAITMSTLYYSLRGFSLKDKVRRESRLMRLDAPAPAAAASPEAAAHAGPGADDAELRRMEETVRRFKEQVRLQPVDGEARYHLGTAYYELGRYKEAEDALKEAIRLRPNYAKANMFLGLTYLMLDRFEEAKEASKEAIRLEPHDAEAHYYLGLAYLGTGDRTGALNAYKIVKDLDREAADELFEMIYQG